MRRNKRLSPRDRTRKTLIDLIDTANRAIDCLANVHFGETKSQPEFMLKVVATSTPSIFGRVAVAEAMRDVFPDLMDILGSTFALSIDTDGAVDAGAAAYVTSARRWSAATAGRSRCFGTWSPSMRLALANRTFHRPRRRRDAAQAPQEASTRIERLEGWRIRRLGIRVGQR